MVFQHLAFAAFKIDAKKLDRHTLNDRIAGWGAGGDNSGQLKPGCTVQHPVILLGSLTAACTQKHVEVRQTRIDAARIRLKHGLQQDQPSFSSNGRAHIPENPDRVLVVPIVDHPGDDVEITADGYGVKEVPGQNLAAVVEPGSLHRGAGSFCSMRKIEENASHFGAALQDLGENSSVPSSDIYRQ